MLTRNSLRASAEAESRFQIAQLSCQFAQTRMLWFVGFVCLRRLKTCACIVLLIAYCLLFRQRAHFESRSRHNFRFRLSHIESLFWSVFSRKNTTDSKVRANWQA